MKLHELKSQLHAINDQINGLAGIIAHNKQNAVAGGKHAGAQQRVIRRQESLLQQRMRLQDAIRCIENSDEAAFAIEFVAVAKAYGDAGEVERLITITRQHMEAEVRA